MVSGLDLASRSSFGDFCFRGSLLELRFTLVLGLMEGEM